MRSILSLLSFIVCHQAQAQQVCQPVQAQQICQQECPSWWSQGWAVTVYSGPITSQDTSKIFLNGKAKFEGSAILALAVAKKFGSVWDNALDFELETQAVQHFGGQNHFEFNPIALVLRWKCFPWNRTLPTTFALGDGISIATKTPKIEINPKKKASGAKVLNYVMGEVTFSLPEHPNWALVARYHHRSGAFGLFNGVHDASTVFAAGLKYWF